MDALELVDGRKRAALALLGLQAADRKWLMAQLPDGERDGVAAMLDELERMNLPPEQIAVAADALSAEPMEPPEPELAPAPDDPQRALARASAAAVYRELRDEPDGVVARVCALRNWRWGAELSSLLGEARAINVARLQRDVPAPAPAVAQALIGALAARIDARSRDTGFAAELDAASARQPRRNGRWWSRWWR